LTGRLYSGATGKYAQYLNELSAVVDYVLNACETISDVSEDVIIKTEYQRFIVRSLFNLR